MISLKISARVQVRSNSGFAFYRNTKNVEKKNETRQNFVFFFSFFKTETKQKYTNPLFMDLKFL